MEDATIADLPAEVVALLTPELCEEMAATFCDRIYYPRFIAIETPDDDEFDFPGLSEPVLYLFGEDQGIMDLGVAEQRKTLPPEQVPTPDQVAAGKKRMVEQGLAECLQLDRPSFACVMAAQEAAALETCAGSAPPAP